MPDINVAYNWEVSMCNAPNIGYSQAYRQGQTVNGITYYDCSSFQSAALTAAGFFDTNPWFTTFSMGQILEDAGFVRMNPTVDWLPGDILVRNNAYGNHTEMVYRDRRTMGARGSSYPLDQQVTIGTSDSNPLTWDDLYRYGEGASGAYDWIVYDTDAAGTMTQAEQENNVLIIYSILTTEYGWSREAIAGALGSMQIESYFNPGQWEIGRKPDPVPVDGYGYGYGLGLIQWTRPYSATVDYPNPWLNYCYNNNLDYLDGTEQVRYLNTGITTSDLWGWIPTSTYPQTFDEYKVSTDTPENLALVWYYNLERPPSGDPTGPQRQTYARQWYDWLEGKDPVSPGPGPLPPTPAKKYQSKDWWCFKI